MEEEGPEERTIEKKMGENEGNGKGSAGERRKKSEKKEIRMQGVMGQRMYKEKKES